MIIYINLSYVYLTRNRSQNRNPVFRKNVGTGTVFKFSFPKPCSPRDISCYLGISRQPLRSVFAKNYKLLQKILKC